MTDTTNLGLPCIEGSQAQKHVTHNDALRMLDALVQLAVLDRDLSAPPASPVEGQRWIVKATGTAAWAGHDDAIAAWQDGGWNFYAPQIGWLAYAADEGALIAWNGSAWADVAPAALNNLTLLGLGTAADATNPLSARLNNALFTAKTVAEGGDGTLRYKLSKEAAADTLSFLFQDDFSGRAEIDLTGDDDFHFKVSADGTSWTEGITIAAATGKVSFPASGGPREVLSANRTYYVRTDGSDSNDGLANTSGGAFLTPQIAYNVIAAGLDLGGFTVTIQIAAGTYTGQLSVAQPWTGGGAIIVQGDLATPDNVIISTTNADCLSVTASLPGPLTIQGFQLKTTTSGNCIKHTGIGTVQLQAIDFNACAGAHIFTQASGANVVIIGNYTISGGAGVHWQATSCSNINGGLFNSTITLVGTPAFSSEFTLARRCACVQANLVTFSGSATGVRYLADNNGAIFTNGGGATFLPGNASGSTATGGQYN